MVAGNDWMEHYFDRSTYDAAFLARIDLTLTDMVRRHRVPRQHDGSYGGSERLQTPASSCECPLADRLVGVAQRVPQLCSRAVHLR